VLDHFMRSIKRINNHLQPHSKLSLFEIRSISAIFKELSHEGFIME